MKRVALGIFVAFGVAACAEPAPPPATISVPPAAPGPPAASSVEAPVRPRDDGLERFEAVVRVDAAPQGKKFQGVWLERRDGERWVVAYRPEGWLRGFEGKRVSVAGERYTPEGQAIMATHFRVHTIRVLDERAAGEAPFIIEVGPERKIAGRFVERVGERGSKLEGEKYTVFEAEDGVAYGLTNTAEASAGVRVRVRARPVVVSPFVARRGGPSLWILDVAPAE